MKRLVICLCLMALPVTSQARVKGYPYLDNETIGMFNILRDALAGEVQVFDPRYWGDATLEKQFGGMLGLTRYLVAGTSYAVAGVAEYTPAYRAPYVDALRRAMEKMLHYRSWQEWMNHYGKDPLAKDNLMFKGFLFYMMTLYQRTSGDTRYETPVTLKYTDGRTFTTSIKVLASKLAEEASKAVDGAGQHHHGIACEPGQVFVICNTQHRVGYLIYDRLNGTKHSAENAKWLAWTRKNMVDAKTGLTYFMYRPDKPAGKQYNSSLSGLYNSLTILFLDALDPTWAKSMYPAYKKYFVAADGDSPNGQGTAVAYDYPSKQSSLTTFALNVATTGTTMALARTFGDEALYKKLLASWERDFGEADWEPGGTRYGYTFSPIIPLVFQNSVPLWARVTDGKYNVRANATLTRPAGHFKRPFVKEVSNAKAFVNQAVYDEKKETLLVTINGGKATKDPAVIKVTNLDPGKSYLVHRDGKLFSQVKRAGLGLTITTPPLSGTEETYTVFPGTPPPPEVEEEASSCAGCSLDPAPGGGALGLALLVLLGLARRRRRS